MQWFFPLVFFFLLLQGCASSAVSREAAGQVDVGYNNANSLVNGAGGLSMANTYQNSSQTAKGVVLGGAAGAIAGGMTNGVGFVPGLAVGAILGGSFGAYIDSYTSTLDKLENQGVKVIVLGDQVMLVLRSSHIFVGTTPNIQQGAYPTLDLVSKLISGYPNMTVKVSGYTNASGPQEINRALSQQQAENVAKYLWRTGVNTRLLYAEGYGGCKLVEKNSVEEDNENYRIEITLEKLPV